MGQSLSVDPDPPRGKSSGKTDATHRIVFLVDVDNTLLDNDRITMDLKRHMTKAFGAERQHRYWAIFEDLRKELGYADYLGALQRYRAENLRDPQFLHVSFFLTDYPFANCIPAMVAQASTNSCSEGVNVLPK